MKSNYYSELPCNVPINIIKLIPDMCVCTHIHINGNFPFPVTHMGCCWNCPFTLPLSLAITCTSHHASFTITVTKYLVPFLPIGARGLGHRDLENIHYSPENIHYSPTKNWTMHAAQGCSFLSAASLLLPRIPSPA